MRDERCERAREYASLRLDGELSDFEEALLRSHLERCEPCRTFERAVAAATHQLRAAPLERPERAIRLPRPRRVSFRLAHAGVAAAMLAATVGISGMVGSREAARNLPSGESVGAVGDAAEDREMRRVRTEMRELRLRLSTLPPPGHGPRI